MRGALEGAGIVGPMGWLSRIRWTRAARAAGIAAGAIAAFATVIALGDAPPPRLADDIGVRMTAPAPTPPPSEPVVARSHPRTAGGVLARATATGFARVRDRMLAARRERARTAHEKPAGPSREEPVSSTPAPAAAPPPAPAPPAAPPPAPASAPAVAAAPPPQPPPSPAGDGEFGFEN